MSDRLKNKVLKCRLFKREKSLSIMKEKVSIIVPIYNAENFLKKTVNSILKQTYRNIEIILVNDCSRDNSISIINEFAEMDKRVVVVDKSVNEGEDYARFSGIDVATGDFLVFLDADDWFAEDAISLMLSCAQAYNADIVYTNHWRVYSSRFGIKRLGLLNNKYCNRLVNGKEKDELFISFFGVNIIPVTMWGAMFRKKLFTPKLKKSGLKFGADLALSMQLYHNAKTFYIADTPTIFYRWGGVTAKYQPNFLSSSKILFAKKMEFATSLDYEKGVRPAIIELSNCLSSHVIQLAAYFPNKKEANIRALETEMSDSVYSCFKSLSNDDYFVDGDLNTLCLQLDARGAYELAEKKCMTFKFRCRFYVKRIASVLLKYVQL